MTKATQRLMIACSLVCLVSVFAVRRVAAQHQSSANVIRLFTGSDGQTHAEKIEIKLGPPSGRDGTQRSELIKGTGARFSRLPAGLFQDWHNGPRRGQYVITMSGRAVIEVANGEKVIQEPGVVILAEDATGKGHTARVDPDQDLITVAVPLAPAE